jgi:hypothetical protein
LNAKKPSTGAIVGIGVAPIALFVVVTFLSIAWLKQLPDEVVEAIALVATVIVLAWSLFISIMTNRRQDEVERASSKWAWMWGRNRRLAVRGATPRAAALPRPRERRRERVPDGNEGSHAASGYSRLRRWLCDALAGPDHRDDHDGGRLVERQMTQFRLWIAKR